MNEIDLCEGDCEGCGTELYPTRKPVERIDLIENY